MSGARFIRCHVVVSLSAHEFDEATFARKTIRFIAAAAAASMIMVMMNTIRYTMELFSRRR